MGLADDHSPASVIPGNALVVDPSLPFRPLAKFGNSFLNRFQCTRQRNRLLSEITLIDTPGILSGEKQTTERLVPVMSLICFLMKCHEEVTTLWRS